MISKRGSAIGSGIITIYRIVLIGVMAIVVLGLSSVFYDYEINVRDSESMIFARQMVDCVVPEGVFELSSLTEKDREDFFSYCGFDEFDRDRFFLSVSVLNGGKEVDKIVVGDEGLSWVGKIYDKGFKSDDVDKYEPGYYNEVFSVGVLDGGVVRDGQMTVEVVVKNG